MSQITVDEIESIVTGFISDLEISEKNKEPINH